MVIDCTMLFGGSNQRAVGEVRTTGRARSWWCAGGLLPPYTALERHHSQRRLP
jgi:hypothetical protein